MCVRGCTCVCVGAWVYVCGCTCVGVRVWVYVCGCTCVGVRVWVYDREDHVSARVCAYVRARVCVCVWRVRLVRVCDH